MVNAYLNTLNTSVPSDYLDFDVMDWYVWPFLNGSTPYYTFNEDQIY